MQKHIGRQTVYMESPPIIIGTASIAGKKEGEGPLHEYFDVILEDAMYGEESWEKAESKLLKNAVSKAIEKAGVTNREIDYICAGDLLNQCTGTNFGLRETEIPFFGLFGACSTMAESISIAAMMIDGGFAQTAVAATGSHFCSAEKQFRYPLEYGGQRPPTAQWTVTGAGAVVLSKQGNGPKITHITTGKIVDMGIKDPSNMGSAMAPAAVDTILAHFTDTGFAPDTYDLIITGDLGKIGREITAELLLKNNLDVTAVLEDCGCIIFSPEQDVHAGGSGCGCAAVTFSGMLYHQLLQGKYKKILLVATGALMSPTTTLQNESIPGIAHAVAIEA